MDRPVFFFDVDNCLSFILLVRFDDNKGYFSIKKKAKIGFVDLKIYSLMNKLIDKYFVDHLELSEQDAVMLHAKYHKEYGLAIEGLAIHHKIDPLHFNRAVDDALPLDDVIKPDLKLRKLLEDMDETKVRRWLFTNAHITHAKRVVRLLGVDDLFEGVTYCDYGRQPLICKPHHQMFEKAELETGVRSVEQCYFIDDSYKNCAQAQARGWTTVHLVEPGMPSPVQKASNYEVHSLEQLRGLFPAFFNR